MMKKDIEVNYQLKHPLQLTKANVEKLESLTDKEFKEYQSLTVDPAVERQETLDRIVDRRGR